MKDSFTWYRFLGFLVFLAGVGMLAFVFLQSWEIYSDPGIVAAPAAEASAVIVTDLTRLAVRLTFLVVMCVTGSLIASKGIHLIIAGGSPITLIKKPKISREPKEKPEEYPEAS